MFGTDSQTQWLHRGNRFPQISLWSPTRHFPSLTGRLVILLWSFNSAFLISTSPDRSTFMSCVITLKKPLSSHTHNNSAPLPTPSLAQQPFQEMRAMDTTGKNSALGVRKPQMGGIAKYRLWSHTKIQMPALPLTRSLQTLADYFISVFLSL